jgi:hypothetical protein
MMFGVILLTASCVTRTVHGSYVNYPAAPFFNDYKLNTVELRVDHVKEDRLAAQLFIIAETWLQSKQGDYPAGDLTLLLDITVEQRSFMHDVELYNAVYVSCVIRDDEGIIYGRENEYISGKRTVIAAAEQHAIITRLLNRILDNQRKRYGDMQKYLKQNET